MYKRQEYGFAPARLIDLKALMGDSSDNIPGVAGVGPKTAGDLLHKFGTLDGVYADLSLIHIWCSRPSAARCTISLPVWSSRS